MRFRSACAAAVAGAALVVPVSAPEGVMAAVPAIPFDFNGDGFAELAVGVPGEGIGSARFAGAVNVIPGSASGLTAVGDRILHQDRRGVRGTAEKYDSFGSVVASGDFDRDGYADLAIGVPGEALGRRSSAGAVNVLYGSPTGLTAVGDQFWHQGSAGVPGANEVGDRFGAALAVGDFHGDGYDDLAIGVPGESIGDLGGGRFVVLRGSSAGLTASGAQSWSQATPGIPDDPQDSPSDGLGWAMASGDFNADGRDDLAVSAPNEDVSSTRGGGAVHILFGGAGGLSSAGNQFLTGADMGVVTDRGEGGLGTAMAAGDFNLDGRDDLAIGNADEAGYRSGGAVAVLYAATNGFDPRAAQWWHLDLADLPGSAVAYDGFGGSLAAGDLNGDGAAELAIGSRGRSVAGIVYEPEEEVESPGAVYVLTGSGSGLAGTQTVLTKQSEHVVPGDLGAGFGGSLTVLPLSGRGSNWLVVGAPTDDLDLAGEGDFPGRDVGTVTAFPGSASARVVGEGVVWHQGIPGIKGTPEFMDMFGEVAGH